MSALLAVDLGVTCGLAVFDEETGRLRSFRSTNFGSRSRMKRAVWGIARETPDLSQIVCEGDRRLAQPWQKRAEKDEVGFMLIQAQDWREALLYDRQQRSGEEAKAHAIALAERVVSWSGLAGRELRHDTAEAILVGLWAVLELGWLDGLPEELVG